MNTDRVVLLVQPHTDSREMYMEVFRQHGMSAAGVIGGNEALEMAVNADAVITEICVPGIDGIELITRLRGDERTKDTPIVVLTACVFPTDRARAEQAGCDLFLTMPCSPDEVINHVRGLLLRRVRGNAVTVTQSGERQDETVFGTSPSRNAPNIDGS